MVKSETEESYIIVGGGSTGSSIAYHLARLHKKVTLVEKFGIAEGNTGKSSALIRTHYSNDVIAAMSLYSLKIFGNFGNIGYSGFTKTGMLFPFNEKYSTVAKENVSMLKKLGINEIELNREDISRYYKDADVSDFDYVAYEPDSGYADPVATSNSYIENAKSNGAKILLKAEVESVESDSLGPKVVLAGGEALRASRVILATNVWTNTLLESSGISRDRLPPITPALHSIIYLRRPEEYLGIRPTLWDPKHLSYYKMEGTTLTAIGSLDPAIDHKQIDIHSNIPENASQEYVEDYLGRLVERLPSMARAKLISTLTGMYDMTPDGQIIFNELDQLGMESVYLFAGLSGHGFKLSPAYGKMASEMLTGKSPEEATFDWRMFHMNRFKSGNLITSRYTDIGTIY